MKLLRHTIYNFIGLGLPLLTAVFTIPVLIEELGEARFGLLTLIWAVVSYFGLFDLGLGRALTQQLAVTLAKEEITRIGPLIVTASAIMAVLGTISGVSMALLAEQGVALINFVPDQDETIGAIYVMALCMPFIVLTSGLRGILEAQHAFGIINAIRLPMGLFTFVGPLLVVLYWEPRLDLIAALLSAGRIVACLVHLYFVWHTLPKKRGILKVDTSLLKPLCVSGGWLTVSNVISPFMGYVDRFIIGAIVSASAVAYYTTPHELATKLWIVPGALTAVLFPTFAAQISQQDANTWPIFKKAIHWLFVILFPVTLMLAMFSGEILSSWISPDFANKSAHILQIFALGILINCMAHIPFTLIQGSGNAKQTAIIHTAELPFFLIALWILTTKYGITGAAIAWLLRIVVDTIVMFRVGIALIKIKEFQITHPRILIIFGLFILGFTGLIIATVEGRLAWLAAIFLLIIIINLYDCKKANRFE